MEFGKILTRAWEIIWKHKVLWIFGILASCTGQGNYSGSSRFSFDSGSFQGPGPGQMPGGLQEFFQNLENSFQNIPEETFIAGGIALVCLGILLGIVFWLLGQYGRVTLIRGTLRSEAGLGMQFGELARDGYNYFWRAVGLNFLFGLAVFVVTLLVGGAILLLGVITMGIALICLLPLVCLLIPLGIAVGVYIELANVALVAEDLDVFAAAGRAWEVLTNNLGNLAIMALILVIGGGLLGLIVGLPLVLVGVPLLFGMFAGNGEYFANSLIVTGLCLVIGLPIVILLGGILRSYIESAWTLTYMEITGAESKA